MLGLDSQEYRLSSSTLVPISGKLPYYQELPTGKVLDFVISHLTTPDNQRIERKVLNNWLYSKTRPGFYLEIHPDLHLAYAHQKSGHNTSHYWRLFFTERWKTNIEKVANSSALFVPPADTNYEEYFQAQPDTDYLLQWSGMYFRSKTEIKIAKELYNRDVLFFANARGQVSCQGSPASENSGQLPGRIEVDFLVFHKSKCMILEVDGQHHRDKSQASRDYVRDRVLLREGIPTVRFTADNCFNQPAEVVTEFLNIF